VEEFEASLRMLMFAADKKKSKVSKVQQVQQLA
jgi:hypothetical protein